MFKLEQIARDGRHQVGQRRANVVERPGKRGARRQPSATFASLVLVYVLRRGNAPRWLLWAFVAVAGASFAVMLPITAAFVGTSMQTFNRLMLFQNWI